MYKQVSISIRLSVIILLCCVSALAYASGGGSISGRVKDPSGSYIVNADVELREVDTNQIYSTHTDAHGYFRLPVLAVGKYNLMVSAQGFADYQRTDIVLNTDDALTLDAPLSIASETTSVTVMETPAHLDPDNTQLGEVISGRQMTAVPLNGRSYTDLLSLQAGVVPLTTITSQTVQDVGATQLSPSGTLNPGTVSINGQREFANAFLVNGADVEEDVNSGTAIVPNLDSIDEFRILISNFDAQYGGYSGGQIKVITKAGTNSLHGSAFDFLRNPRLDARNYFSQTRGDFHQNQYGGTLGGPIRKDKLFFFADYQGTKQTVGVDSGQIAVPSLAYRAGDFSQKQVPLQDQIPILPGSVNGSYFASLLSQELGHTVTAGENYYVPGCTTSAQCVFPNAVIPQSAFSLPAQHLLQYIPSPNFGSSTFTTSSQRQVLGDNKGGFRTDYNSRFGQLSAYYFIDNYNLDNPYPVAQSGANVPGFNALNTGRAQLATVALVTTLNEKSVNEAHVSYMRDVNDLGQPVGGLGVSLQSQGFVDSAGNSTIYALAPSHVGVENIVFNNFSIGTAANELRQVNNIAQATNDFTHVLGTHTVRVGFGFHHDEVDGYPIAGFNGNFQFTGSETGSDFADFLLGVPTAYNQSQLDPFYGRDNYYGAYAQDSWRVNNSVVMNYGVRFDHIAPWSEEHNEISTFRAGAQSVIFPGAPAGILYPGDPGVSRSLAPAGNEFSPRFGISYTPHPSSTVAERVFGEGGKTTLRAGFGMYYTAYEATTLGVLAANAPYGTTYTSPAPSLFQNPFITASTGQNLGQQFPVELSRTGVSRSNPNVDINWAQFTPISGIPGFSTTNRVPYVEEYTASIERQLSKALTLNLTYTGNTGHRLLVIEEANPGDPALCLSLSQPNEVAPGSLTCGPTQESSVFTRPDGTVVNGTRGPLGPNFGSDANQLTNGPSSYNAGEINVHYTSKRLEVIGAYTYAKSLDESSNLGEEVNPINPALSYAISAFDIRHNFVVSYNYELPFESLLRDHPGLTKGWRLSGITHISSGVPITLVNNSDYSYLGTLNNGINNFFVDTPDATGQALHLNHNPRGTGNYFNSGALAFQVNPNDPTLPQNPGTPGDVKRRYFYGPGQANYDMALQKSIPLKDQKALEVRFESFNVFNHAQFFGPSSVSGVVGSSNFGQVVSTSSPRICQGAIRLSF